MSSWSFFFKLILIYPRNKVKNFCLKGNSHALLKKTRNIICHNQEFLSQYMFGARNYHREFRKALAEYEDKKTFVSQEKLSTAYAALDSFLLDKLRSAVTANLGFSQELFINTLQRNCYPDPRCGIKVISGNSEESALIVPLWGTSGYENAHRYPMLANTAAVRVFNNPRHPYIENNIPAASADGDYENPRIDIKAAKQYVYPSGFTYLWNKGIYLKSRFSSEVDNKWTKCWSKEGGTYVDPHRTYKSTLVTPIALNSSKVSKEFINNFTMQCQESSKFSKIFTIPRPELPGGQFISAFFCVDTHIINYFDTDIDKEISYFIADWLYLYFFIFDTYTRLSKTYSRYHEIQSQ